VARRSREERIERRRLEGLLRSAELTSRQRDEQLDALHAVSEGLRIKAEGAEMRMAELEGEKRAWLRRNSELQTQLDEIASRSPMVASALPPPPLPSLRTETSSCAADGVDRAAADAMEWIGGVTGLAVPNHHSDLFAWLKSGVVLCELIKQVGVNAPPKPNHHSDPFSILFLPCSSRASCCVISSIRWA
jgi:hypothetical protein